MWGFLVLRPGSRQVVTWAMDARRFAEEELPDDYEVVSVRWDEGDLETAALALTGPGRVLSDCGLPGTEAADGYLRAAQYPMSDLEMRRLSWIAARVDVLCRSAANALDTGISEREAAVRLGAAFMREGFAVDEMMVGFDERLRRYRHPVPREARLERVALLHPTVNHWGLHGITTRMVHLGRPSSELSDRFRACSEVEAWSIAMSRPGVTFGEILQGQRLRYEDRGHPDAWHDHWQGGLTGFVMCEPAHVGRPDDAIPEGGIFNWFITLPGAKKEELTLATAEGGQVLSLTGAWPTESIDTDAGRVDVASLLVR